MLQETRRMLFKDGYRQVNIRTVAKACQVTPGTVYDYFESKDGLVASVVLEDWIDASKSITAGIAVSNDVTSGMKAIYHGIYSFIDTYSDIFRESTRSLPQLSYLDKHRMLIGQIEGYLISMFEKYKTEVSSLVITFIAESLLIGSKEAWNEEEFIPLLIKLTEK